MRRIVLLLLVEWVLITGCQTGNMPAFNILLPDSSVVVRSEEIPSGKSIVFVYFKSDCAYCHEETQGLINKIEDFKSTLFYFVTTEDVVAAREYRDFYKLSRFENIKIGVDTAKFFPSNYNAGGTPVLVVFDRYKRLRGVYGGVMKADTLLQVLRKL